MRCRHCHVVVADDGRAIRLALYDPAGAIGRVGELIAAAQPRFARG